MTQHITIGFDKPQEMITTFLARFNLENYGVKIVQDNPNIMIHILENGLKIGDLLLTYPLLLTDFISTIKRNDNSKNKGI